MTVYRNRLLRSPPSFAGTGLGLQGAWPKHGGHRCVKQQPSIAGYIANLFAALSAATL